MKKVASVLFTNLILLSRVLQKCNIPWGSPVPQGYIAAGFAVVLALLQSPGACSQVEIPDTERGFTELVNGNGSGPQLTLFTWERCHGVWLEGVYLPRLFV